MYNDPPHILWAERMFFLDFKKCLDRRLSKLETGVALLRNLFDSKDPAKIPSKEGRFWIVRKQFKEASWVMEDIIRSTGPQANKAARNDSVLGSPPVLNIPAQGAFLRPAKETGGLNSSETKSLEELVR